MSQMSWPPWPPALEARRAAVDHAIAEFLRLVQPRLAAADQPAVGWIYQSIRRYLENGGKRLHAVSMLLAASAVGGSEADLLPVVVGFQLYHHHTMVHDDVYDDDDTRRGQPTVHRAFSAWAAADNAVPGPRYELYASDLARKGAIAGWVQGKVARALAVEAIRQAGYPPAELLRTIAALNWHDLDDNAGQLLDVYHEANRIPAPALALQIAHLKTGRLFGVCVGEAARLAGAAPGQIGALQEWAIPLGTAYQLQDDLEDLEEDGEKGLGRVLATDLKTCKPTYTMALALERAGPAERRRLRDWISRPQADLAARRALIEVIQSTGAPQRCRAEIEGLVEQSDAALSRIEHELEPAIAPLMRQFGRCFLSAQYWKRPLPAVLVPGT